MMMIFGKANVCRRVQECEEEEIFLTIAYCNYIISMHWICRKGWRRPLIYIYKKKT